MHSRPITLIASWTLFVGFASVSAHTSGQSGIPASNSEIAAKLEFFENQIRPVLIEHCTECHGADSEASGGLLLDSRPGWQRGGDSGAAIVAGDLEQSSILRAISYDDPDLQMPPEGKLPPNVIRDFSTWIADGAEDPRDAIGPSIRQTPAEDAKEHWAYQALGEAHELADAGVSIIDQFIDRELAAAGLDAVPLATRDVLVRRLSFDLTGLPPAGDVATNQQPYDQLVEQLLDSQQFGEQFARNWMDVARYAESITLRGFVLPEAWRYRDYLITAYMEDRPFDQMIREQIAGDLLHHDELAQRQLQVVATGFLTMGNTNLEQQDKAQLEMDYIDEQLETIGRAFLGQTIGCARCHDHKFDPIPTRDYYALAGIMSSTVALEHSNVSKWIEQPLPLSAEETVYFDNLSAQLDSTKQKLKDLRKSDKSRSTAKPPSIAASELAGVVIDNGDAELVGEWIESTSVGRFVGSNYLHDGATDRGQKTVTFEPPGLSPGEYVVRMSYTPGASRASNALIGVFSADGEAEVRIDQRKAPPEDDAWISLGTYRFEEDGQAFVLVSNEEADGHVIADAVQFLPVTTSIADAPSVAAQETDLLADSREKISQAKVEQEIAALESEQSRLSAELKTRPQYITLIEKKQPQDIAIRIRGDVHQMGEVVPRGVLSAVGTSPVIASQSSGRVELAEWLSSPENPLTARVYANRVWSWLMGRGLVSSVNNFGTTGANPTHPELLDWLATELIHSGWSTKHLVRTIVLSDAYRRRSHVSQDSQIEVDPDNTLYWCGQTRRLSAEQIRDAMLSVSGELDKMRGGSLIRPGTNADYGYRHLSPRRSIYQPVFRNSLPDLFEAFDFADPSVSVGRRSRSTVATQALVLMNHPWVVARAAAAAHQFSKRDDLQETAALIAEIYQECFHRPPTAEEMAASTAFLESGTVLQEDARLALLIHAMFASLDFRYLE